MRENKTEFKVLLKHAVNLKEGKQPEAHCVIEKQCSNIFCFHISSCAGTELFLKTERTENTKMKEQIGKIESG